MTALLKVRKIIVRVILAFVVFMVVGNVAILAVHMWAKETARAEVIRTPAGVHNFQALDDKLWRGSRPTMKGYRSLVDRGVTTIIDLRAEDDVKLPLRMLERHDVDLVTIRMRDGQVPRDAQVDRFLRAVRRSEGKVYVHCMAGVGRTGTMVAAYLIEMKDESTLDALRHNLEVGPPSLEQIAFVAGDIHEPNAVLTGVSRVLDGPRRIWSYLS